MGLPEEAKPIIKKGLYSLIYGMNKKFVTRNINKELKSIGLCAKKTMASHPIIRDVAIAVEQNKKKILHDKKIKGAFGMMYLKDQEVNSFLSCYIQSFELALDYSCYMVAINDRKNYNEGFDIVLHQHDGFSILLRDGANWKSVKARLEKAFADCAYRLGIPASLDIEHF